MKCRSPSDSIDATFYRIIGVSRRKTRHQALRRLISRPSLRRLHIFSSSSSPELLSRNERDPPCFMMDCCSERGERGKRGKSSKAGAEFQNLLLRDARRAGSGQGISFHTESRERREQRKPDMQETSKTMSKTQKS